MIGQSKKSGIEIKSEYQLTGHPVIATQTKILNSKLYVFIVQDTTSTIVITLKTNWVKYSHTNQKKTLF